MSKYKCDCGKLATWYYMPNDGIGQCCDDCVPRGCSCQRDPIDGDFSNEDSNNWIDQLDDDGRLLPCIEWEYDENGWDKPDTTVDKWLKDPEIKEFFDEEGWDEE